MAIGGFWGLLSESEQGALSAAGRHTTFAPGATICTEGEPATHLYVLLAGWVKVFSTTRNGQELLVALRGQGEFIGEVAGDTAGYRTATIRTGSLVRSLIVRHDRFSSFLDSYPGASRIYRQVITQRWNETSAKLINRAASGATRLAAVLIDLAERYGVEVGGEVDIRMPLSQDELASLAGSSRAAVTRTLADWRQRGLIRTAHRHTTITNLSGLRRIADG